MLVLCKMFAISESLRSGFYEIQEIRELSNRGRVVKFPASARFSSAVATLFTLAPFVS